MLQLKPIRVSTIAALDAFLESMDEYIDLAKRGQRSVDENTVLNHTTLDLYDKFRKEYSEENEKGLQAILAKQRAELVSSPGAAEILATEEAAGAAEQIGKQQPHSNQPDSTTEVAQ